MEGAVKTDDLIYGGILHETINAIRLHYAKDDSIAFVASILTGYEKKKALLEQFMEKGILAQTHRKRNTEPER